MTDFPFFDDKNKTICLFCGNEAHSFYDSDRDLNVSCKCDEYIKYILLQKQVKELENGANDRLIKLINKIQIEELEFKLKTLKGIK